MVYTSHCYDIRTFLIYIDSYENGNPVGYYYNSYKNEMVYFGSLTQFLERLEESLDVEDMPQAYQSMRTFSKEPKLWWTEEQEESLPMGRMATFEICILFRRNSTWQGKLLWLKEGCEQSFRSVLELIFLMNSALEETKEIRGRVAT